MDGQAPAGPVRPPGVRVRQVRMGEGDDFRTSKSLDFKSSPVRFPVHGRGQPDCGFAVQLVGILPPSLAACQTRNSPRHPATGMVPEAENLAR